MDYYDFLLPFLILSLTTLSFLLLTRRRNLPLPPGPSPLPVVGNIFQLRDKPHKSLTSLARVYGPLMSLRLGQVNVMVVSSASVAKEVLHKNDSSVCTRPVVDALRAHRHHDFSVLVLPIGEKWLRLRKICNTKVFSNSRLDASQHLRQLKAQELISYVGRCCKDGVAVEIGQAAFTTSLNFLSNTFFSVDLAGYSSSTCREFKQLVWAMSVENSKPNIADYFPILRKLDPQGVRRRMDSLLSRFMDIFGAMIQERLNEGGDHRGDVLDELIKITQERGEKFEHSNIMHFLMDLIAAGTETTSGMIEWTMAQLISHPDKLKKAKAELQQVIGQENPFLENDILRLPYFKAIIKEIFRLHPTPIFPRQVDSETVISGFRVPKGSRVWINLYAMGRDPSVWQNPEMFEPERFMDSKIDLKGRDFEFIPFGAGRRICPGLPLAMRIVPLMVGSLIHSFDWKLENEVDAQSLDMEDRFGTTLLKAEPLRAIPIHV